VTKCDQCSGDDRRPCYDSDVSDQAFTVIEPILQSRRKIKSGRPVEHDWRDIFYVLRTGCQWRQVPHDLTRWWVTYRWFRTLIKDGTWRAIHDELHRLVREKEGRAPEPTACSLDAQSAQSAGGGEQIGFDKFKHCRGRKRNLCVDTLGFLLARQVTSATVSDRVADRAVLQQAKAAHPDLAKGWVDDGYANTADDSILDWSRQTPSIDLEVVKRSDDVKGFVVIPWR
jgi:transposase